MNEWNISDPVSVNQRLDAVIGHVRIHQPPAELTARLEGIFAGHAVKPFAGIRRVLATLHSDTLPGVLAGARGATTVRQVVFTSDSADISIQVRPGADGLCQLDGMVLPHDDFDGTHPIELRVGGEKVASVRTDSSGSFRIADLNIGTYEITVGINSHEIVAGPLEVAG